MNIRNYGSWTITADQIDCQGLNVDCGGEILNEEELLLKLKEFLINRIETEFKSIVWADDCHFDYTHKNTSEQA